MAYAAGYTSSFVSYWVKVIIFIISKVHSVQKLDIAFHREAYDKL